MAGCSQTYLNDVLAPGLKAECLEKRGDSINLDERQGQFLGHLFDGLLRKVATFGLDVL